MYNTTREYLEACILTGLKRGDIVHIERMPIPEDGKAVPFLEGNRLWSDFYSGLSDCIGYKYKIDVIDSQGLISVVSSGIYTSSPTCVWRIPFFILSGYDHFIMDMKHFSYSKYLDFDRKFTRV